MKTMDFAENKSKCRALTAFPVSPQCFCSAQQAGSLGLKIFLSFFFLTGWQSCYAMNRFLYILITSTSWCERGRLQICSPSGLISFYQQILAAAAAAQPRTLMKMEYGISVKCCTPALASLSAITAATTIGLILLLLVATRKQQILN